MHQVRGRIELRENLKSIWSHLLRRLWWSCWSGPWTHPQPPGSGPTPRAATSRATWTPSRIELGENFKKDLTPLGDFNDHGLDCGHTHSQFFLFPNTATYLKLSISENIMFWNLLIWRWLVSKITAAENWWFW